MTRRADQIHEEWKTTGTEKVRGEERDIVVTMGTAPLNTLRPDGENQRLYAVRMDRYDGDSLTIEQCFEELWRLPTVKQLTHGIETARGLTEALIVLNDGTVMEGNERLTALNKINERLADGEFDEESSKKEALQDLLQNIPIRILPNDLSNKERALMLADLHLGGKDQWDAINQAKAIYDMNDRLGVTVTDISYRLRKSRTWVYQRLVAYEWAKRHFDRHQRWGHPNDFSYFAELHSKKKVLSEVGFDVNDDTDLHQFMDWVADGQITRALDVRKLPKILKHEETKDMAYNGNLAQAFNELKFLDSAEASPRFAAIERMNSQLDKMTIVEYNMIRENEHFRQTIEHSIHRLNSILQTVDNAEWMGDFSGGSA